MNIINFCSFCGARDLDDTPGRTKCRACGEEFCLLYPEELEALEADRRELVDAFGRAKADREKAIDRLTWLDTNREEIIDTLNHCAQIAREMEALP